MKRRDFLKLRSSGGQRIVTLSCERLYMAVADCRAGAAAETACNDEGGAWWAAEPPRQVNQYSVAQLFDELGRELGDADVLVLEDRDWLQGDEFVHEVENLLAAVRRQRGEIRYAITDSGRVREPGGS
ncbi:MAG: hypothetical protein R3F41_07260 [Gammaproteobacteria bacterium]|nr:hypothetical protein [Pseudomonadales bacterium]MCP5348716.1 hypothetical protein [Pseudomonadales bacterium]